jgi:uncharacterized protein (TIGR02246 family)
MLALTLSDTPQPDANYADGGWLAAARDMATRWAMAFNAADVNALAALYDKDAVMFPTGRAEPVVGAEAVHQFFAGLDWTTAHVELTGAAFSRLLSYRAAMTAGAYTFSRLEGGTRAYLPARYSFVLTRNIDAWRIAHHHSSAAPQPLGAERRREVDKADLAAPQPR